MKQTAITLNSALEIVDKFCPIKIAFNNCILYDDYDNDETHPPMVVIPNRLYRYSEYVVTAIKVDIVQYHHSIITFTGYLKPNVDNIEE